MSPVEKLMRVIAADRPRWSAERQRSALPAWETAFRGVPPDVMEKAAVGFLKHHRGTPDASKIFAEIRRIEVTEDNRRSSSETLWTWDQEEVDRLRAEVEEKGDPLASWLRDRGIEPEVDRRARLGLPRYGTIETERQRR